MMIDPRIFMGILEKKFVRKRSTNATTQPHTNWDMGVFEPSLRREGAMLMVV